jgi:YYY domain-containing protein
MSDAIIWYLWVQVFALCGWTIAGNWLGDLPDRGYGISKALGVLLVGFTYWWIVTLGLAPNLPGAILLSVVLVIAAGLTLRWFRTRNTTKGSFMPLPHRSVIIATELVFGIAFLVCAVYRSYTPQIVEAGGEKFMESMFLNAILRSPSFPPNDAWLAGSGISYYYFGYILLAMVTRISGVAPAIGFNLGGAMIFALTLVSAFSVGYNLWGTYRRATAATQPSDEPAAPKYLPPPQNAILAGLLAAIMLGVMGNMGGVMESVRCMRILPQSFWTWLDIRQIAEQPVQCQGIIPTRFYWWWDWSRVVHDYTPTGADQEVITEMPAFSFVLGDNHPHVMDLPFVAVGITLALYYLTSRRINANPTSDVQTDSLIRSLKLDGVPVLQWLIEYAPHMILTSIIIGGLSFMNTWDFPIYGALLAGAVLLGRWYRREQLLPGVVFSIAVFVLGYLFYIPFYSTFASQARGIGVNLFNGTRFVQFFMMFAPFIVTAPLFMFHTAREQRVPVRRLITNTFGVAVAALALAVLAVAILGFFSTQGRAYLAELSSTGSVAGVSRDTILQRLLQRGSDPWTSVYLLVVAAFCSLVILRRPQVCNDGLENPMAAPDTPLRLVKSFVLLLFLGGALLTVAVEFIYLQDLFGTRMNTVFKFYYQAWTVWAIAGSFALMTFLEHRGVIANIGTVVVGLLLLAGLLYPIYAAASKTDNFSSTPTLDGSAYLKTSRPEDAQIIDWLNQHVQGSPVILEAPADHYGAYVYNGRISAFTGLPTLLGWGGHEHQWRGNYDEPARREPLIETLYNTTDIQQAQSILRQFGVRYVVVGQLENSKYAAEGLAKFAQMCRIAYQIGGSQVYECNP